MSNENNPIGGAGVGSSTHPGDPQDPIDATKNHVRQAAEDLRSAAEAKAREFRSAAEAKAEDLKNRAGEYYDQARHQAEEYYGQARDRARTFQQDGETYVRENPLRAVVMALGAGFVLGLVCRR